MDVDNNIFNVNGRTLEQLKLALQLATFDEYGTYRKIEGWKYVQSHGLILLWHADKNGNKFPVSLKYDSVVDMVWEWLQSDEAKKVPKEGWDANVDHDGDNEIGWRVYCEDWGHVAEDSYAIVAIKPAYLWYGK